MARLVVLPLVAVALLSPAAAARSLGSPALSPVALEPLRVRGAGFDGRERVRVTAETSTGRATRRVRATRGGRFVVTFRGVRTCDGVAVSARGSRGSRASLQVSASLCRD
jgi:hypothetical protein